MKANLEHCFSIVAPLMFLIPKLSRHDFENLIFTCFSRNSSTKEKVLPIVWKLRKFFFFWWSEHFLFRGWQHGGQAGVDTRLLQAITCATNTASHTRKNVACFNNKQIHKLFRHPLWSVPRNNFVGTHTFSNTALTNISFCCCRNLRFVTVSSFHYKENSWHCQLQRPSYRSGIFFIARPALNP
jgi:hypothetical protein